MSRETTICWVDQTGDRLEKESTDPGRIFEFWLPLAQDLRPHGVLVTNDRVPPGVPPRHPFDIERVVVQKVDPPEDIEMPGNRPLVVARFGLLRAFFLKRYPWSLLFPERRNT